MIKEVLLLFKTHLDIGFTDYAENVKKMYLEKYIPNAIEVGYELKNTDSPFIWTVGSWLVNEGLKQDDGTLENAINDGIIAWHGFPFTTHTELMSKELFEYGLSISEKLDKRFNKKTLGAKMTDVPGHTLGMVPLMCKHGIEFMHIGGNQATPRPDVPGIFKWKCGDYSVNVINQKDYGSEIEFDDFAVVFGHTRDNQGAQTAEEVVRLYDKLHKKYHDAVIKAATLNDVAVKLRSLKNLPVLEKEVGDTWIHGGGTDPKKLGMYRELLRYIKEKGVGDADLSDNLLLVPEHTWGMDVKTYFHNARAWLDEDFKKTEGTSDRVTIEKSWQEQRNYVMEAEEVLGVKVDYTPSEPKLDEYKRIDISEPEFEVSWQLYDTKDYTRYLNKYTTLTCDNIEWASWDQLKIGLPVYEGGVYAAAVTEAYESDEKRLYKLEFDSDITEKYGLPYIWAEQRGESLEIIWFGKRASRLPQAFWLKLKNMHEDWEMSKMGQWIKPKDVIGSPLISAVDTGVRNDSFVVECLDSALVAPFGRRLLDYDLSPEGQDMYFNLYNNIWNTNFPMWYSDDTRFRFVIKSRK